MDVDAPAPTAQDVRAAKKLLRRYDLTGYPFSRGGWLTEVGHVRLAIAVSLVEFFTRLRWEFS